MSNLKTYLWAFVEGVGILAALGAYLAFACVIYLGPLIVVVAAIVIIFQALRVI